MVDAEYYYSVYLGQEAPSDDFAALEARAADVIGAMTRWQATSETIANLPAFQQAMVKKAVCAQIDFFAVNGIDSVAGSTSTGFTVGKVSVNGKSGGELVRKGAMADYISPLAVMYLEQSGLMSPHVAVFPDIP